MKPRRSLFTVILASLIPQPVLAFDSGVNAMTAVDELEQQTLQAWAFSEFVEMTTGFRVELEPILPMPQPTFSIIDSEIANFVAQGQIIQARLQQEIDSIGQREERVEQFDSPTTTPISTTSPADAEGFFYSVTESEKEVFPELTMTEEGRFKLDTSKGIDLPDVTFDPRDGGTYESEIPAVQEVFDVAQLVQDQVPQPIQSTGTDLYNTAIGFKPDADHRGT